MSLEQQIAKIIGEARGEYADTYYIPDSDYADKILSIIKKRIDLRIQYYRKNLCFTQSDPILLELEDIKKELLK